jgi:hypothetical protein
VINKIDARHFCERPLKPWDNEPDYFSDRNDWNVDLMRVLGGYGKALPKLSEMALACGIPAKIGGDGAEVAQMWLDGRCREIVDYNECDVLTTYLLWLGTVHTCGLLDDDQVRQEEERLDQLLEDGKAAKPHLAEFQKRWHALQGREGAEAEAPVIPASLPEPPAGETQAPSPAAAAAAESFFPLNPVAKNLPDLITAKQLGMIRAMARTLGIDAEEECFSVMNCNPAELSKKAASSLIQHLQDLERQSRL